MIEQDHVQNVTYSECIYNTPRVIQWCVCGWWLIEAASPDVSQAG